MIPGVDVAARLEWLYEKNPGGPRADLARARATARSPAARRSSRSGCSSTASRCARRSAATATCARSFGGAGSAACSTMPRGATCRRTDIGCMYGAPGAMNVTPLKHGGSREVGHVARWVRPLRGAAIGLAARRSIGSCAASLRPRFAPTSSRCAGIDAARRRGVGRGRADDPARRVRDATFYTWRFLDAPAHREPAVRDRRRRPADRRVRARV